MARNKSGDRLLEQLLYSMRDLPLVFDDWHDDRLDTPVVQYELDITPKRTGHI
ncbi:MAG: hypothetical protein AAGA55_11110 [Planctomycetota bacterium]